MKHHFLVPSETAILPSPACVNAPDAEVVPQAMESPDWQASAIGVKGSTSQKMKIGLERFEAKGSQQTPGFVEWMR